jgi:D-alanyl-D-alanine carboxypeptidase (penicillin-binding protein 5/6)
VFNGVAQNNHDPLLGKFPGADGIKTGFTGEAHYNYLGSAERNGRRLLMVLAVEKPGDRAKAARADGMGLRPMGCQRPVCAGAEAGGAKVQGGAADSVDLLAPRHFATVPHGAREGQHEDHL